VEVLHVDVNGYEGPLDLLLDLARRQKVDLAAISILALVEQYLAFIDTIRERRIEVAADYLVMAAWLAYLKSRLMVPQAPDDEEPSGEMLAAMLQFRLKRLEAMRLAASRLLNRPRLGIHVYARGAPEPLEVARKSIWEASYYELLKAYSVQREREPSRSAGSAATTSSTRSNCPGAQTSRRLITIGRSAVSTPGGTISTAVLASSSSPASWWGMKAFSSNAHRYSSMASACSKSRVRISVGCWAPKARRVSSQTSSRGSSRKRGLSIR
jgi:hypothetical protein